MPAVITITIREDKEASMMRVRNDSVMCEQTKNEEIALKVLENVVNHVLMGLFDAGEHEGGKSPVMQGENREGGHP